MTPVPPIDAMIIFAHVVDHQGFSTAASALNISKSAVSKSIASLEDHLHTRLLHRTTRKLHLTEAGERFYMHCKRILEEAQAAEAAVTSESGEPRGLLRISAPYSLGPRFVLPIVLELLKRYPRLEIDLRLDDALVDLVATGTDVAVRVGRLADSSIIARKLATVRSHLVASESYLAEAGTPQTPEELSKHRFILYTLATRPDQIVLEHATQNERVTIRASGPLMCNHGDTILNAVLSGVGIGLLPDFIGTSDFCSGRLKVVLPEWHVPSLALHAVYPQGGPVSPAVRVFVDALARYAERLLHSAEGRPFALALENVPASSVFD